MDKITLLIKDEIKAQYKSLKKFCEASGIPYSTMSNALSKGISGTAYGTVLKICKILNLQQSLDQEIVLINSEFKDVYEKLTALDEQGAYTVRAVLNAEYLRCASSVPGNPKSFNGIGYANADRGFFEKEHKQSDDK